MNEKIRKTICELCCKHCAHKINLFLQSSPLTSNWNGLNNLKPEYWNDVSIYEKCAEQKNAMLSSGQKVRGSKFKESESEDEDNSGQIIIEELIEYEIQNEIQKEIATQNEIKNEIATQNEI